MSTLQWLPYGAGGQIAKGDRGRWRVVQCHEGWHLSVEPPFTRGMLSRGEFASRQGAMDAAQEREDGEPFKPTLICAT